MNHTERPLGVIELGENPVHSAETDLTGGKNRLVVKPAQSL